MAKVVLYHAECNDGVMAAAIVSYFEKDPTIIYHPVHYNRPLPDIPKDSDVIVADFCHGDVGAMFALLENSKSLLVIDHHADAIPVLDELLKVDSPKLQVVFDSENSGAGCTWRHYTARQAPLVVQRVRGHDLYKNKVIDDDYFFYGVMTNPQTISYWASLIENDAEVTNLVAAGRHIYNFVMNSVLPQMRTKVRYTSHAGYIIPIVNCNRVIQPLVLDKLIEIDSVALAYEDIGGGKRKWSVRSSQFCNGAAKRIANSFHGGGHQNAAGFVTEDTFMFPILDT